MTVLVNKGAAAQLSSTFRTFLDGSSSAYLRPCASYCQLQRPDKRHFTTTPRTLTQESFPRPETKSIKITRPAWKHPVYTEQQMAAIPVVHREKETLSDSIAFAMLKLLRFGMDTVTGYSHPTEEAKQKGSWLGLSKIKSWLGPSPMTERKWLSRFLFLESVAGVPGMVAGSVRHLHSLRRLKRDNGWIETLLEEAYNERMHLLTFLKIAEPGRFMKLMIIGAQGVYYNMFFISYLFFPRACHRFVGYLEEEAVLTYTIAIKDLEAGKLPKWEKLEAPEMAIKYWNMPEGHRTMRDLLLYIRADEAKHREVNHTLGNLEQKTDPNPFVSEYENPTRPHPTKGIDNMRPTGWNREEVI